MAVTISEVLCQRIVWDNFLYTQNVFVRLVQNTIENSHVVFVLLRKKTVKDLLAAHLASLGYEFIVANDLVLTNETVPKVHEPNKEITFYLSLLLLNK